MNRDQKFFDMYSLVIGVLAIIALLIFVGAMKLSDVTQGIYTANTDEYQAAVVDRIQPLGRVLMPGEEASVGDPVVAEAEQPPPVEAAMSGPQVYNGLATEVPAPDLVIYLQAPVNVLLDRIAQRGIEYEESIDADYLQRLVKAYTHYFYHFEEAPLVIVNAAEIDYANKEEDYQMLFEQLQSIQKGRHYLNPLPF